MSEEENNKDFKVCEGLVIKAAKIRTAVDNAAANSLEEAKLNFKSIEHNKKLFNSAIKESTFGSIYSPKVDDKGETVSAGERKLLYKSLDEITSPALKAAVLDAIRDKINK